MNLKYNQLENEDSYEYGLRLIETKIEQNPPDLEWSDIVDLLGLDIHYDSLRKAANVTPYCGYRVMKYFKEKYARGSGEESYLGELDQKMLEFQKRTPKIFRSKNSAQQGSAEYGTA